MSSSVIKNIIHKFVDKEINILYDPTYSMFDYLVFDLPFNFFINTSYHIPKDNVVSVKDLNLFSYDLAWCYGPAISDIGYKHHIPTLQYVPSFIAETMDVANNVLYVLEGANETGMNNLCPIDMPYFEPVNVPLNKIGNTALINCYKSKLDNKIVAFLTDKIPNLKIIEDISDLPSIANYKTVIDLYPDNISNLLFALVNHTIYITTPRPNTNAYQQIYKNIILGTMILDVIQYNQNALTQYSSDAFASDHAAITRSDWSSRMIHHIHSLKQTGFYIS